MHDVLAVLGFSTHHHDEHPWRTAPPWAIEHAIRLGLIHQELRRIMSQNDDLNAAISTLATASVTLDNAILAEITAMAAANAGSSQPNPVITQGIANIQAITTKMAQEAAALTASIPAATTIVAPPPSAPVVDVAPTVTPPTIPPVTITAPDATPPAAAAPAAGDPLAPPVPNSPAFS